MSKKSGDSSRAELQKLKKDLEYAQAKLQSLFVDYNRACNTIDELNRRGEEVTSRLNATIADCKSLGGYIVRQDEVIQKLTTGLGGLVESSNLRIVDSVRTLLRNSPERN